MSSELIGALILSGYVIVNINRNRIVYAYHLNLLLVIILLSDNR